MKRTALSFVIVLCLFWGSFGLSHGALIFGEDFSGAIGTGPLLVDDILQSEKWGPTNYYIGGPPSGLSLWTFSGQAFLAQQIAGDDKAILLNESPHGIMSKPISVNPGGQYLLTFEHWGDNRAGNESGYRFNVTINDINVGTISRVYNTYGTLVGITGSIPFTAPTNSIVLKFQDTSISDASPIIDNIRIAAVPIPAAAWLLGTGLIGLVMIRRRMKK